jgi:peptidoglycan/LPS O-acetylase OafA/YrhL
LNPVSPIPAIVIVAVALWISYIVERLFSIKGSEIHLETLQASFATPSPPATARNASIDGLRGLLAVFVFAAHSLGWYYYLHSGEWTLPPSYFYTHLGQSSVMLFFMITAFLFVSKLLDASGKSSDIALSSPVFWRRLFVSRFMRLTPLYFFMLTSVLVLTAIVSDFKLREPWLVLLKHTASWASFIIFDRPNLNGVPNTWNMISGVNWTLPYEWFFYFSLPIVALVFAPFFVSRNHDASPWPPFIYVLFSAVAMAGLWLTIFPWRPAPIYFYAFAGGFLAALLLRFKLLIDWLNGTSGAVIAVFCLTYVFTNFADANNVTAIVWLTVAFTIMASGNSIFGLLHSRAAQSLSNAAYSIYLLHGLVIYITFKMVIGSAAAQLSATQHWGIILVCTVILIPISFATFRWIEAPAIRNALNLSRWLDEHSLLFFREWRRRRCRREL